jgi:hypothetical protein
MIQRKQTIYLLLALAALIVCLCLPIGKLTNSASLGAEVSVYNIGLYTNTGINVHPILFVDIVVVATLSFINIFLYKKRKLQMKLCLINIALCLVWYAYYAFMAISMFKGIGTFSICFAVCLPLVAIVLQGLARSGIKADEELIKSMSRIR